MLVHRDRLHNVTSNKKTGVKDGCINVECQTFVLRASKYTRVYSAQFKYIIITDSMFRYCWSRVTDSNT